MSENCTNDLQTLMTGLACSSSGGKATAVLVADTHCELGECVLYNYVTDQVLWTDIYGKKLFKLTLSGANQGKVVSYDVPKMLCAFALLDGDVSDQEGTYLCAWQDGFEISNIENNSTSVIVSSKGENVAPHGLPTRLNDGRCDNEGHRFICGGYYGERKDATMKIFKVESQGAKTVSHEELFDLAHAPIGNKNTVQVTNSICFSPSGEIMYLADSPTRTIFKYEYNKETGTLANKSTLVTYPPEIHGVPDGSCVDSEGYIWNAVWRGGKGPGFVNRIHPETGEIVFVVNLPDSTSQTTCCCFGGVDLNVLFIISACEGRDKTLEPNSGGLYAVKLPFQGRKEARFHF